MKKYSDMICGMIGIVIAVVLFILSLQINMKEGDLIGAGFLPIIVSIIVFFFSLTLTMRGWKSSKIYVEKPSEYKKNTLGVWLMIAACFLYAALLKPVGFIIDSAVFLYFTLCMMTKKESSKWGRFAVLAVASVVIIYMIFIQIFGIRLPKGIL